MSARSTPTPEQRAAFEKAAKRWNVPITLLMAIARVETGFDAEFSAPAPSTARGMFRATDEMRAAVSGYAPADGSELEQQITLAAVFLSVYLDPAMWAGSRPGAILSFYFAKGELGPYDGAIEAGAGRTASLRPAKPGAPVVLPPNAAKYLEAVQLARKQLSDIGKARGNSELDHLYYAMQGLEAANDPTWCARPLGLVPPHIVFDEQMAFVREWMEWSKQGGLVQAQHEHLAKMWEYYEIFFELAPVTDVNTPLPERIIPKDKRSKTDVLAALAKPFEDAAAAIAAKFPNTSAEALERLDKLGEALAGGFRTIGVAAFLLIAGLGTVYILANRRSS